MTIISQKTDNGQIAPMIFQQAHEYSRICRHVVSMLLVGVLSILASEVCHAESQIYLKDGRVIKVQQFWREEGLIKYKSFGGVVGLSLEDVDHIVTPDLLAFQDAQKADTIEAYESFLKKHARSDFAQEADKRIKALKFQTVKEIHSAKVYLDFIRRNPNSEFLGEAKENAEILIFQEAVRSGDDKKYADYLEVYPEGRYSAAALKAVELLKYRVLIKGTNVGEIEAFLRQYPESAYRQELEDRIAYLVAESQAKKQATVEGEQMAREVEQRHVSKQRKRLTLILSVSAGLAALIVAAVVFFRRSRRARQLSYAGAGSSGETWADGKAEPLKTQGPARYEDLIGVRRDSEEDKLSLPEPRKASGSDGAPIALPEPSRPESGASSPRAEEQTQTEHPPEAEAIILGNGMEGSPESRASSSDREIDLSDHEATFKVKLEDVADESEEEDLTNVSLEDEIGISQGDLPELFDEKEKKRRRGGGFKG